MIIEQRDGKTTISNNSLADKIADANYYLAIAMATGNTRNKRKWLKRLKELKQIEEEGKHG